METWGSGQRGLALMGGQLMWVQSQTLPPASFMAWLPGSWFKGTDDKQHLQVVIRTGDEACGAHPREPQCGLLGAEHLLTMHKSEHSSSRAWPGGPPVVPGCCSQAVESSAFPGGDTGLA